MMPSAAVSNGKSTSARRFELPVLAPLASLTAGTDIPPPPESPIEENAPATIPKPEAENLSVVAMSALVNGQTTNGTNEYTGRGRTNGPTPTSPVSPTRPSSIRRFLSRKSLNQHYTDGTNTNPSQENLNSEAARPESPSAFSTTTKGSKRRSGSWFRRFVTGGNSDEPEHKRTRTSIVYEEKENTPKEPPPPTLPELGQLKAKVDGDAVSLGGGEMFKNIK